MADLKLNRDQFLELEKQLRLPQRGNINERVSRLRDELKKPGNRNTLASLRGQQQGTLGRESISEAGNVVTTTGRTQNIPVQAERLDLDESLRTPSTPEEEAVDIIRRLRNRRGLLSQDVAPEDIEGEEAPRGATIGELFGSGAENPSGEEELALDRLMFSQDRGVSDAFPEGPDTTIESALTNLKGLRQESRGMGEQVINELIEQGQAQANRQASTPDVDITESSIEGLAQVINQNLNDVRPEVVDEFVDDKLSEQAEFELRQANVKVNPQTIEARKNQLRDKLNPLIQ